LIQTKGARMWREHQDKVIKRKVSRVRSEKRQREEQAHNHLQQAKANIFQPGMDMNGMNGSGMVTNMSSCQQQPQMGYQYNQLMQMGYQQPMLIGQY